MLAPDTDQLEIPTIYTAAVWQPLRLPEHPRPTHTLASHSPPASHTKPLLSIFPGIDLLGMAFELEGFCVVRGPDTIFGGDIRTFHPPANAFEGIIGGSPCQDFSRARRTAPTGEGLEMLGHWSRVVTEGQPDWALLENVPTVPNLHIDGYIRQRLDVRGTEVGLTQRRIRHFQFFTRDGRPLCVPRRDTPAECVPAATASEARRPARRSWPAFCALQGLVPAPPLEGMHKAAKYRAVGNGVPLAMGRLLAHAINAWSVTPQHFNLCICGCGREIKGRQLSATVACRKRLQRCRHSSTTANGKGIPCPTTRTPQLFPTEKPQPPRNGL